MQPSFSYPPRRLLLLAGFALLAGSARAGTTIIDPDSAPNGQDISTFYASQGVTLSHTPDQTAVDDDVYALSNSTAGSNVFAWNEITFAPPGAPTPPIGANPHWEWAEAPDLIATLNFQVQSASIQIWSDNSATLSAFDGSNQLIGSTTVGGDRTGFQTLAFSSAANDITKVVVSVDKTAGGNFGLLDHLVLTTAGTPPVPEPGSLALLALGGLPLAGLLRRRKR